MAAAGEYIRARREYFGLCWQHAQQHVAITVGLTLFAVYNLFAWAWPVVDMPNIKWPKVPLPWVLVIVLAGITFMVVEGGQRLRQKEFGQDHNLHFVGIIGGTT